LRLSKHWKINLYVCIYTVTPWSRILRETLTGLHLVKKFLAFYGTRRFPIASVRARHLSVSWARSIQCMSPRHFLKIHFNSVFPSTPRSSKWPLSFRSYHTNPLSTSPVSLKCHMTLPSDYSWGDHLNDIWRRDRSKSCSLCSLLQSPLTSILRGPNNLISLYSRAPFSGASPSMCDTYICAYNFSSFLT
jgi:hypothetical protein